MNHYILTNLREPTYEAARAVAKAVEEHFEQLLTKAKHDNEHKLFEVPKAHLIEAIIDAAFWSSLRREEGQSPKISLALISPEQAEYPLLFESRLPLTPEILTKLAPGVERPGIHLGVWHDQDELFVWGTMREASGFCFVLDVSEPGLLVIKHRQVEGFGKFVNVAVLIGNQVKVIDEQSAQLQDCPALLTSLLGITTPATWSEPVNVLIQLAVSMRAHGRGGSLLIVPADTEAWRDSIIQPMKYGIAPAFTGVSRLMQQKSKERASKSHWESSLRKEVDHIAGLTAVDGTTIINDRYELLTFGAKIQRLGNNHVVDKMVITEPILGGGAQIVNPAQTGGTRHLSAAQFVFDQRDSLALVASQDGRFTAFAWSPCEEMVHAHRIDVLLL